MYLIGIVVSRVVEVVADCRGQHNQQVNAVHLTPQVSQPDQTIHLLRGKTNKGNNTNGENEEEGFTCIYWYHFIMSNFYFKLKSNYIYLQILKDGHT